MVLAETGWTATAKPAAKVAVVVLDVIDDLLYIALSLIPVFGVGGAYLFLGERLTVVQGLGMGLIMGSVSQIARSQSVHK